MSIPTEKNTSVKVTEKLSKYKDLEIEIEWMWGMKATTIPVVIGALGLIKRAWRNTSNESRVSHQNYWTTEDRTTKNISYPKKDTLHQIDFYLI